MHSTFPDPWRLLDLGELGWHSIPQNTLSAAGIKLIVVIGLLLLAQLQIPPRVRAPGRPEFLVLAEVVVWIRAVLVVLMC